VLSRAFSSLMNLIHSHRGKPQMDIVANSVGTCYYFSQYLRGDFYQLAV